MNDIVDMLARLPIETVDGWVNDVFIELGRTCTRDAVAKLFKRNHKLGLDRPPEAQCKRVERIAAKRLVRMIKEHLGEEIPPRDAKEFVQFWLWSG